MPDSHPSLNMSNLRDFFSRSDKEKLSPDLKRALALLGLSGFEALEERFLSADAFLRPWAVFRDSILLLQPDAMPRPNSVEPSDVTNNISRSDILWFYTQFDEDMLRYDPRADKYSLEYTPDSSVYGMIDKNVWSIQEYEKHLYAWLLQEFKVGKSQNPQAFRYFELKNICSAWQEVLVPIVNAVRASYNVKGRQYYGRLALFVESRCPSRLAFPEGNVGIPEGGMMSPTPYRVVSVPKKMVTSGVATFHTRGNSFGMLTKKHYDEAEKELRDVYPQYGGLVERPKFKHKMEDWLAEQRARANLRKAVQQHGEVNSFQPQLVQRDGSRSPSRKAPTVSYPKRQSSHNGSPSPIKRYSDSIRRSLSLTISKRMSREEPKSPLHGVTRQVNIPDDAPRRSPSPMQKPMHKAREQSFSRLGSTDTVVMHMPRPDLQQRNASEQSVYSSIRNSNPFTEDLHDELETPQSRAVRTGPVFSPMGPPSAIPRALHHDKVRDRSVEGIPFVQLKKSFADIRIPSYEGTGYADEISLTNLHTERSKSVRTPEPVRQAKQPTRLPVPIQPVPYAGHLRAVSKDANGNAPPPKPIAWPSPSPPKATAWPGFDDGFAPPIPPKSPSRLNSTRGPYPKQLVRDEAHTMTRIVSKENIRAALDGISRESSTENLAPPVPKLPNVEGLTRTMSPNGIKLHTYNTHLFPRKGTPVGGIGPDNRRAYEARGAYEMEVLSGEKKRDQTGQES
ncbi:uncharacterized protein K460DRAFT_125224 [Cucurbitaria berberidis CBS 394.84]|uniref:Uncharacterized protein n=1 Tax=Cucurbitaria berberidis CBS 394.84 TaxID=1168544 RepID=A0A9P4GJC3_9PLEO|nr:uncharacterized protein K460DRAFT_125224 [Cucurbitaria berberidis CBS 394.84]KAF1846509.1 hypothetical protein K460DRAFT_125224 [Cucurbitaria berberidis CBS 394.84]